MADMREALTAAVRSVSKDWKAAKGRADKEDRVQQRDLERMRSRRSYELSIKDAAYWVMWQAYSAASANGTLPANARQIMYAARPYVLKATDGKCWRNSSYFTQHLLPDYMDEHQGETAGWTVVFDARGRLWEPHTGGLTDLGTLEVRQYIGAWANDGAGDLDTTDLLPETRFPTWGPANRYRFALFIEKEGFNPLLRASRIAERFDLAIMSTKGMSVTAARELVEALSDRGVTILALCDFDKAGFSIVHTLKTSGRRYHFHHRPHVVSLGLRLTDVEAMGLASETVVYDGWQDPRLNLRENGATEAECKFLVRRQGSGKWYGERVELNAMMADQFVKWLEAKLAEAGVEKVIPEAEVMGRAYRRAMRLEAVRRAVEAALAEAKGQDIEVPADLVAVVASRIIGSEKSWDDAIWDVVRA